MSHNMQTAEGHTRVLHTTQTLNGAHGTHSVSASELNSPSGGQLASYGRRHVLARRNSRSGRRDDSCRCGSTRSRDRSPSRAIYHVVTFFGGSGSVTKTLSKGVSMQLLKK